jgi:hypothetical protein
MESFATWWEGLSLILKVFWALAVPFTVFFLLQLVLSFIGVDSPDDMPDAEITADHGFSFQFITLKNMVAFFTIFAWTGIACIEAGIPIGLSLLFSTLAGLAMVGIMAGLFFLLMKANADGTMRIEHAIGEVAEVYLTIQSNRRGAGKVQVKITGALRTLDALTDDESDIQTGRMVKISSVVNGTTLLVTSK